MGIRSLVSKAFRAEPSVVRRNMIVGLRHRWGSHQGARVASEWPGRSRKRSFRDQTPPEQKARELANWKRSKVGRRELRRRRRHQSERPDHSVFPVKRPGKEIRQEIEEAKHLRNERQNFLRHGELWPGGCPFHDLALAEAGCRCPF